MVVKLAQLIKFNAVKYPSLKRDIQKKTSLDFHYLSAYRFTQEPEKEVSLSFLHHKAYASHIIVCLKSKII